MKARLLALAAVLVLLPTGCGGNSEDAYCAALKSDQTIFADDGTGVALITNLPKLLKLEQKSPDDLDDEWQTFTTSLESLRDAIKAAGLKPSDFVDGKPPAGTSAAARTAIAQAADQLSDDDVVTAASGIEQQAKDVCKLQLGL
ncbi:hypothetical protein [Nocardioides marmorisolisilvae]|uniref:Uncharacterized protein n=1 Tax=Nocardioides marmorisolisilvae TaxID=1542737 RepID=A0A3N0DUZ5_9ACTN|nr:hypothetical protein [Nocardioides marmorisolisilvae]RNL79233.1 hypothetical protein EFL95_09440 [Nocardioides marmorisolisilvae]